MGCIYQYFNTSGLFELPEYAYNIVFQQPSIFNSKFEGFIYHAVLEFELVRTSDVSWSQNVILQMSKLTSYSRINLIKFVYSFTCPLQVWINFQNLSNYLSLISCFEKKTPLHESSIFINGCNNSVQGGSEWGTHVNPWLIHVNVWQKPLQYCKVISLQLVKINEKKLNNLLNFLLFFFLNLVMNWKQKYLALL